MLKKEKIISLISNRLLELIILPTEQCNFRCTYCYEDFTIGRMKENVISAIKNLILKRIDNLDVLKISWFGGEPLAAKKIVFELSEFLVNACQHYPNLRYIAGMTTNGFSLKFDVLNKLINLGVKHYQISLDGTESQHNQTRKRLNGEGSFQAIWGNLLAAKQSDLDFSIMLRIHLTPYNLDDVIILIEKLKRSFGYDQRFSVFFKTIENLGGPNSGSFKVIKGIDKNQILENFYNRLDEVLPATRIDQKDPYVCYAAKTNSFVIRANGKIAKCTVAFNDERNNLGALRDNGTIDIDSNKLKLWTRGLKSTDASELSCPMSNMPKINTLLKSIPIIVENK